MVTLAIWLGWVGVVSLDLGSVDSEPEMHWRVAGLVLLTAAAIVATVAVN